jgi:26 proteasome complex subunit DSS1
MSAASASGGAQNAKKPEAATPAKEQKPTAALEEDDEFEDFPVEGTPL